MDDEQGDHDKQNRANDVAGHDNPTPHPSVEKYPDKRPEHREGQENRRERHGDGSCGGGSLRREENG